MIRRYHYVREGIESNQNALIWITNNAQVADTGTKISDRILLDSFKEHISDKVPDKIKKFRRGVEICLF
jgi:hypothetical protein